MKKFKFKLQKLLDIKIKEEEESKLNYTKAQNDKKVVESNLEALKKNYEKYSNISNFDDITNQKIIISYLSTLTHSIKVTNEKLKEEEIRVSKAKGEFIQKQIKRKSLETLKENEMFRLMKEEERVEQITNDEFALYAYIRNHANVS